MTKAGCHPMEKTKIKLPRERFIKIVEDAFEEINAQNKVKREIADVFRKCGQDPWRDSTLQVFQEYLSQTEQHRNPVHLQEESTTFDIQTGKIA